MYIFLIFVHIDPPKKVYLNRFSLSMETCKFDSPSPDGEGSLQQYWDKVSPCSQKTLAGRDLVIRYHVVPRNVPHSSA